MKTEEMLKGREEDAALIASQELASVKAMHPTAPNHVQILVAAGNAIQRQNVLAASYVESTQRAAFLRYAMRKAGVLPQANERDLFATTGIASHRK